jgi:hypothetical protein
MIVAIVRKPRAYPHAERAELHARAAGVRAYKYLRANWCRDDKDSRGNQTEYKFIHRILRSLF